MANTRSRKPKAAETEQEEFFDPTAIAGTSAAHEEDEDGNLAADHNDGSGATEEDDGDEQPVNPLERTRAGMTEGTQAAQAEINEYLRRKANLLGEMAAVRDDIKELDKEFKGKGYDMKAMALLVKIDNLSDISKQARREQNAINATYAHAAGIDEDLL